MNAAKKNGISFAGNTHNPCLLVMQNAGYKLWLEPTEQGSLWCASKDDIQFMGHSGAELLGIVTLWEQFGTEWNKQEPNLYAELLDEMEEI